MYNKYNIILKILQRKQEMLHIVEEKTRRTEIFLNPKGWFFKNNRRIYKPLAWKETEQVNLFHNINLA